MQVEFHQLSLRYEALRIAEPARQARMTASIAEAGQHTPVLMVALRSRVTRLEALLAGILSYSRAGRVVDAPEEIDLGALVKDVADMHVPGSFTVEIGELPVLASSRTSLEQIFGNLFSNAVRHHDRGRGVITVSAQERGAFYEFTVQDDGPGIPPEFQDKVFEMFQTLKPRDAAEGSGLGMAIIKKLIEWQGGRIWVESSSNVRGTAIHFLWPREFKTEKSACAFIKP